MEEEIAFMSVAVVALSGYGLKLLCAFTALLCARGGLWWFDSKLDFNFKEWLLNAEDIAKAIYLGARLIAVLGLFAYVLS